MTRLQLPNGTVIEIKNLPGGGKRIEIRGPFGMGELTLDANSASEVAVALLPHPEEADEA